MGKQWYVVYEQFSDPVMLDANGRIVACFETHNEASLFIHAAKGRTRSGTLCIDTMEDPVLADRPELTAIERLADQVEWKLQQAETSILATVVKTFWGMLIGAYIGMAVSIICRAVLQ